MFYYDLLFENPSGLWPLDSSAGTVFTDVSGFDQDAVSSALVNLFINPSFESSSGTIVTRTSLVLNPNAAIDTVGYVAAAGGGTVVGSRQTGISPSYATGINSAFRGTFSAPTVNGSFGGILYGLPLTGFTAGRTYSFVLQGQCSVSKALVLDIQWYTSADVFISSSVSSTINAVANTKFFANVTAAVAPATAAKAKFFLRSTVLTAGAFAAGEWIEMTGLFCEETDVALSYSGNNRTGYFSGSGGFGITGIETADFTYAWSGTAHASTSTQLAPALTSITRYGTPIAVPHQSTDRAMFGAKSMKIIWDTGGIYQEAAGRAETGFIVGQVYTASAYVWVPTGSSDVSMWCASAPGATYSPSTMTTKNQWVRVSATWTATSTSQSVGIINNGVAIVKGTNICYVDGFMVEQASTPSSYIDGSMPNAIWSGTAHQSSSISPNVEFLEPVVAGGAGSIRLNNTDTLDFPFTQALIKGKETRSASIEFWIKNENTVGTFSLLRNGKGITLTGTDVVFDLGGTNTVTAKNVIEAGIGNHIVCTYNTSNMQVYIDNELVATGQVTDPDFTTLTATTLTATVTSGRQINLDNVVFYNYTLASNAIYRHYLNSTEYESISNLSQGNGALQFNFDDLHTPVAARIENEYTGITSNTIIIDNEIHLLYNPDVVPVYPAGTYTQMIQFDALQTGTAANAKVEWEVDGDPSRVTVESSTNGTTWAAVTNGGLTTNLTGSITSKDFYIRVTISAGATDVAVWGLTITVYKPFVFTSSDTGVTATVTGTVVPGEYQTEPSKFNNDMGIKMNNSSYITISPTTDYGTVGTVEFLIKPLSAASPATFYTKGSARIYRDATGLHFPGFDRVVINGVSIADGDTVYSTTVGWKHVVATLTTPSSTIAYLGATATGTEIPAGNPRFGYLAYHQRKMTLAEAQSLYAALVGATPVRVMAGNITQVGEHNYSATSQPVKIYAMDWAISESGE